jgi:soluble lytic murein transglycosylase-like protein
MRICFIIILAGILQAADAPPEGKRIVSVVRADPQTGRLVRSVTVTHRTVVEKPVTAAINAPHVVPSAAAAAPPPPAATAPKGLDEAVEQTAARHALPAELLHSVIRVESNYNPNAVSPKGALGLMQLIPETARRFGVGDVFNPLENLEGGARYLRYLLDLYGGNYPLALAAYNAGEGAVAKYGGVPPYRETQNYLLLVKKQLDKALGVPHVAPPPPAPPAPDGAAHIEEIVETDGSVRYVSRK